MNRRLLAAAAGLGALSLALVGGTTTAGASTAHRAKPSKVVASITVSPNADLKAGSVVTVTGSGWPASKAGHTPVTILITECNADGAGPGETSGSCDLKDLKSATTSSTGTFTAKYPIVTGAMTAGKTLNDCPQSAVQAEHAVECVLGAADLSTGAFALSFIHFTAPALKFTFAKASPINGRPTDSMKITETGDYVANAGGFEVIGAYGTAHPPSRECQGTTSGKTWTPPGLPACTSAFGEVVQINLNGVKVILLRVDASGTPGDFTWTLPHTPPGTHYTVEALGLVSGEKLVQTTVVP